MAAAAGPVPLAQLPRTVTPTRYSLTLTIDPKAKRFRGHDEISVDIAKPVQSFYLHGLDLTCQQGDPAPGQRNRGQCQLQAGRSVRHRAPDAYGARAGGQGDARVRLQRAVQPVARRSLQGHACRHRLCLHPVRGDGRAPHVSELRRAGLQDAVRRRRQRAQGRHGDRQHAGQVEEPDGRRHDPLGVRRRRSRCRPICWRWRSGRSMSSMAARSRPTSTASVRFTCAASRPRGRAPRSATRCR